MAGQLHGRRHTATSSLSRPRRWVLALTATFLCTAAETVDDRALNFRVTIPDGFERATSDPAGKNALYAFLRSPGDPSRAGTAIRITRLGGTLPSDLPMKDITRDGVRFEVRPVTWKSHTLRRSRAAMDVGGQRVVVLNVQVPLKPEAVAINVAGPESDEKELSSLLLAVLGSLDGESNWVSAPGGTTTEEAEKAKKAIGRDLYVCLAIAVVIGVVIYIRRQGRRDKASS